MGTKADNAQIGQSGTASQNFNIRAGGDGTLRFERGNAGSPISEPLRIETNNDLTPLGNILAGVLGAGQTWQDVKASRAVNTTYTNTTGKPIVVHAVVSSTAAASAVITISGVALISSAQATATANIAITAIIPPGATYSVGVNGGTATLGNWLELR